MSKQWNVRGKSLAQLTNVFQDNVDYPDLLCLQEVGGLKGVDQIQGISFSLGKQSYTAYSLDTKESWRGVCLAVRHELTPAVEFTQPHPFGVLAKLALHGVHWHCTFLMTIAGQLRILEIQEFRLLRNLSCQPECTTEFCLHVMLIRTLLRTSTPLRDRP